jgi:hypothetical protein
MSTGSTKLWAIDSAVTTKQLFSFTDTIAVDAPSITSPGADAIIEVNVATGVARDIVYSWSRLSYATQYDMDIALDEDFKEIVRSERNLASTSSTVVFILGPTSAIPVASGGTGLTLNYMLGVTYYWRVRASAPMLSPWTEARMFKINQAVPFALKVPADGAMDVSTQPTFVWSKVEGAINYELMVAEDPTFAVIDFSRSLTSNMFKSEETLKYATTYYWRVRGVFEPEELVGRTVIPGAGTDWQQGVFTTEAAPPEKEEPIVIVEKEPAPPPEVKVIEVPVPQPQAIPSYLLWLIIGIGAVLIIALIVLIVRTRRVT